MIAQKKKLALAESCTGGMIAARLTQIPGASKFFLGSLVVYSDAWKERFLQVSHTTLKEEGSVSQKVVEEMSASLLMETDADFAIAVSGIAGPGGGTAKKPVGTIYFAIQERGKRCDSGKILAPPDRASAIELSTQTALGALWRRLVHNAFTFS
jgi:nicotinamide-nucleotide amidase